MTLTLTAEFNAALNHLHAGNHLFLTGKAGTGKSTLVRLFLEQTHRNVLVAAPTGMAALNVGGMTLHRLFGFRPGVTEQFVRSPRYSPGANAEALGNLHTLVIDEASMVRADLFDAVAAALELYGPQPGQPFGGVQLMLVGDVYQLPPVVTPQEQEHFNHAFGSAYFFGARNYPVQAFPTLELSYVFRQEEDARFATLLNGVRTGTLDQASRAELNEHVDPDFEPPAHQHWLTLTTTNRMADAANRRALESLDSFGITAEAESSGDLTGFEYPSPAALTLKVGAQVMMVANDPLDRWVNGTLGEILDLGWDEDGEPWAVIATPAGDSFIARPYTWEVLSPMATGDGGLSTTVTGTYTQLPIRLAWAVTIHKAQGQTLERAIVDIRGGVFSDGQLYVALSRVRSLAGLKLRRRVYPKDLRVDPTLRRFLASHAGLVASTDDAQQTSPRKVAYVGVIMVGDTGQRWKPRPLEIAVVTSDGKEISTLVNPGRDLGDAAATYGVDADMLMLAPNLEEALAGLGSVLHGHTVVTVEADVWRGNIDFELKRVEALHPLIIPLDVKDVDSPATTHMRWVDWQATQSGTTALERARALAEVFGGGELALTGYQADPWQDWEESGYLVSRTKDGALTFHHEIPLTQARTEALAQRLEGRVLGPATIELKAQIEDQHGIVIPYEAPESGPPLTELLQPGVRIAFTGSTREAGRFWDRDSFADFAEDLGFATSQNVTKTRTDLLVLADPGSESGKAKKARHYGTPMYSLKDFLEAVNERR